MHDSAVDDLRSWMLKNNIKHSAAGKLLKWLQKHSFIGKQLPADSRTFLATPRTVVVKEMGRGKFI